jgi:FKBP-type peptidyl-prolyl cis-trans isomerase FklB
MKLKALTIATTMAMLTACGSDQATKAAPAEAKAETEQKTSSAYASNTERASYGIGLNMANNVKGAPFELDNDAIVKGVTDGLAGAEQQVTQEDISKAIQTLQEEYFEKQKLEREKSAEIGKTYLAENAKKPNIKVTESGLQYEVIQSGKGRTPKETDKVKTHYHGTLISGEVFDSSVERGEPAEFQVNRVIKGWTEALQLMKEGDKWRLHIPAELAYGERSPSPKIPPNSALVFEVELLEVVDPKAAQPVASEKAVDKGVKETAVKAEQTAANN